MIKDAKGQTAAVVSLGYPAKGDPLRLTLRVPVNAWVAKPANLTMGKLGLGLPFRVCIPQGCLADLALVDKAMLAQLTAMPADAGGSGQWQDAFGREQQFPVSAKGLASVLAQLR